MKTLADYCQSMCQSTPRPVAPPRRERRVRSIPPGVILRVSRLFYWHYGVSVGDGQVMVLDGPNGEGRVRRVSLQEFAGGGVIRVVAVPGQTSLEDTLRRALAAEGWAGYDLLTDNCEHFATWCATGQKSSRQVVAAMRAALIGFGLWAAIELDRC